MDDTSVQFIQGFLGILYGKLVNLRNNASADYPSPVDGQTSDEKSCPMSMQSSRNGVMMTEL